MGVKSQLEADLTKAMRSNDDLRKRTLRLALSAINLSEIDQRYPISDKEVEALLLKEIKARRESIEDARRAGRQDLIDESIKEIEVLEDYLPEPMTAEEIEAMAREAIAGTGASSQRDMG